MDNKMYNMYTVCVQCTLYDVHWTMAHLYIANEHKNANGDDVKNGKEKAT